MSSNTSPLHYNELEDHFITDANFKVDINQRMKVPHKISLSNDVLNGTNPNAWAPPDEALNMKVPPRILVAGQNQHIGTAATPREIVYDNSILATDSYPGDCRVATPPRSLTLDRYAFPGVNELEEKEEKKNEASVKSNVLLESYNDSFNLPQDLSLPIGTDREGLSSTQEISHLRREMAKLNRRIMALELENLNRLQKEKIVYGIGIAYFLLKAIIWMNRSSY